MFSSEETSKATGPGSGRAKSRGEQSPRQRQQDLKSHSKRIATENREGRLVGIG